MLPSIFGENLFDSFFSEPFRMFEREADHELYGKHAVAVMRTDVRETDNTYELDIDLPGFKKDQITASVENGYLTVTAAKGLDKDEGDKNGRYVRRERWAGQCSRSFYVGEGITDADVHAKFEDGILRLSIPKAEQKALPEKTYIAIE